jgi:hypothetical protein
MSMSITAHIVVQGAERAAAFYRDAFAAEEVDRIPVPDGRLMSVQLRIGDSRLHLADEFPELGVLAPPSIGGTAVVLACRSPTPGRCLRRPSRPAPRSVSRWPRSSGVTCTASSRTPSGTAGTSASTSVTCRTARSLPPPREPSPERRCPTTRGCAGSGRGGPLLQENLREVGLATNWQPCAAPPGTAGHGTRSAHQP